MKLQAHPSERRRRGVVLAAHGCCCCCCCLHTLGGLAAAGVESSRASTPEARKTVRIYWLLVGATTVVGVVGATLKENIGAGLFLAAFALPVAQLNAAFVGLLVHAFSPLDLRTLGRLAWKGFFWAFVGLMLWLGPCMISV